VNKKCPRIVAFGGGTGLSTLLRGIKKCTRNVTGVVTVTDDGGSSGALRRELGVLPPGDIRNCLVSLSEQENLMARLLQYRFPKTGSLSGHSFGNLFLTAMSAISGGFDKGVASAGEVLAIIGRVLPVTLSSVALNAELENGKIVKGESNIAKSKAKIKRLSIYPSPPPAGPSVLEAIGTADAIIFGPGSLYTSIIANLLVKGITRAIRTNKVPKIYVLNIMTQPGETTGYSLSAHLEAINSHAGEGLFNYVIVNNGKIPAKLLKKYAHNGQFPVKIDVSSSDKLKVIKTDIVSHQEYARHDSDKLAAAIMKIIK
jgi:uncharacterized cofD-like protein